MGYTTDFQGSLRLSKQPTPEQVEYINTFSESRRMKRNAERTSQLPDPIREAVGLPVGEEGAYYVGGDEGGNFWDKEPQREIGIIDYNTPPGQTSFLGESEDPNAQPGLWCQWVLEVDDPYASEDSVPPPVYVLRWNGGEKLYHYTEWLQYLINHFFNVWDIKLTGEITWQGEDSNDFGLIVVTNSIISVKQGRKLYV